MTEEELRKQAWDFFHMQAGQRLTTFNFYIAISSLLSAGLVATFKTDIALPSLGMVFGLLLVLFSFIFWKLDQRNRDLIRGAEAALKFFESKVLLENEDGIPHVTLRFSREEFDTNKERESRSWRFWRNHYSYSQCFSLVFSVFGCGGLVGVGCSVARLM